MPGLLVFLHGLSGNQHSWGAVPDYIQRTNFEIITPTYASGIRSRADIAASAKQIATQIETRYPAYEPIFLIGHSLGGLVAREICRHLLVSGPDELLNRIRATLTVGTPLEGARYGNRFLRAIPFLSPKIHQIATEQYAFGEYREAIRIAKKRGVNRPKQLHIVMEENGVISRQEEAHFTEDDYSAAVIPGTHQSFNARNEDAKYVADVLLAQIRKVDSSQFTSNKFPAAHPDSDVRLGFKWDDEQSPERANFRFKIFAENRGPLDADIGDVFAEFRAAGDDTPVFFNPSPRPFNTSFKPGQVRDVYSTELPGGDESLLCCGFLRWSDKTGASWEQLFRMRLRAHPRPNEHHFTQVGDGPWNRARPLTNIAATVSTPPPRVLQIEVGESGPFFETTGGLYDIKRTFKIKLSNVHNHKTAANCKVQVTKIEPQDEYTGPWPLKEMPSLAAGDHAFIPLARYGEARDPKKFNCADSFFTTYLGTSGRHPSFDVGRSYVFTLRATAIDSPMCEFDCKLWVDEAGRFRIAQV